jgi:hypothetical protein
MLLAEESKLKNAASILWWTAYHMVGAYAAIVIADAI